MACGPAAEDKFTEEQVIGILREREAGAKTAGLARKCGAPDATLYSWKAQYGGMDITEAGLQRRAGAAGFRQGCLKSTVQMNHVHDRAVLRLDEYKLLALEHRVLVVRNRRCHRSDGSRHLR